MKIAFYTLGCKVNQYETQALEQLVTQRGHSLVPFEETADAYVINTCTVTAVSDKKSRQVIRRARKAAPDAVIAVCGCYPQTHPDDVEKLGVDLIAGTGPGTAPALWTCWSGSGVTASPSPPWTTPSPAAPSSPSPPAGWRAAPGPC